MSLDNIAQLAEARAAKGKKPTPSESGDTRPVIRLAPGELRGRVADEAEAALVDAGAEIYQQGPRLVRIVLDKIQVSDGGEGKTLRLSGVTAPHVLECFERVARFEKWDARAEDYVGANCPKETSDSYMARDGKWRLRYLLGVITAPTLRADGSILETPGYDPATCLVFDPVGYSFPAIPAAPTEEEGRTAIAKLIEPIREFKFINEASRSVALSAIMTAVIRRSIPTAPLHAFTAPVAGSGKSMLVDIAAMVATGERAAVLTSGKNEEELEKRLVGSMLAGDAILSLDNLEGPLGSDLLNALLTQTRVKLRALGKSVNVDMPITTSFYATANNLVVIGDMTRRTLTSGLDPEVEQPELREFNFNALEETKARRGELVAAVLTAIRARLQVGPARIKVPLGSFERWSVMVRDTLVWLGQADPVLVMEGTRRDDPRLGRLQAVLAAWAETFGEHSATTAEAIKEAQERIGGEHGEETWKHPGLRDALLAATTGGNQQPMNPEKLSWFLRKNANRYVGGYRLEPEHDGKSVRWRAVRSGAAIPVDEHYRPM